MGFLEPLVRRKAEREFAREKVGGSSRGESGGGSGLRGRVKRAAGRARRAAGSAVASAGSAADRGEMIGRKIQGAAPDVERMDDDFSRVFGDERDSRVFDGEEVSEMALFPRDADGDGERVDDLLASGVNETDESFLEQDEVQLF